MLNAQDVKSLRQEGKLREAHDLGVRLLNQEPDNIWNKRAIAWVYYDYLKQRTEFDKVNDFIKCLDKIVELNLPHDESMIFDSIGWKIVSMVSNLYNRKEEVIYTSINTIFNCIKTFHFSKPSDVYSVILKTFTRKGIEWEEYIAFIDWWGLDNFRLEDYEPTEYQGNKQPSLVEKTYNNYSKKLLELYKKSVFMDEIIGVRHTEPFLEKLNKQIIEHPEYKYLPLYKAKLLIRTGDKEAALSTFLPFARKRKRDYWVWEQLSGFFENDAEKQICCLCHALSCNTEEKFLIKVRLKLANLLTDKQLYDEAKTELELLKKVKQKNGWNLKNNELQLIQSSWYSSCQSLCDNKALYEFYRGKDRDFLYDDLPTKLIIVSSINEEKRVLNFLQIPKPRRRRGMQTSRALFNRTGFFTFPEDFVPKIGEVLQIRLEKKGDEGYHYLLTLQRTDEIPPEKFVKEFAEKISIKEGNSFGFITDIYVPPNMIREYNLTNDDLVTGKAIISKSKDGKIGFKVFTLKKLKAQQLPSWN